METSTFDNPNDISMFGSRNPADEYHGVRKVLHNNYMIKNPFDYEKIKNIKEIIPQIDVRPDSEGYEDLVLILDLEASLLSAEATIISALDRKESRGAHQRSDFEDIDDNLKSNYRVFLNDNNELQSEEHIIEKIPDNLQKIIDKTLDINLEGRLLE